MDGSLGTGPLRQPPIVEGVSPDERPCLRMAFRLANRGRMPAAAWNEPGDGGPCLRMAFRLANRSRMQAAAWNEPGRRVVPAHA